MKKYIQRLLSFMLILFMAISVPLTNPITAHALAGSMTDADAAGSGEIIGGPTAARNGWIFYLIDPKTKTQVSNTICCTNNWNLTDRNGQAIPDENKYIMSRYGIAADIVENSTPWGFGPFNGSGEGKGTELKSFLLNDYSAGVTNAYHLIETNFGHDYAEKFMRKEIYLSFEGIYGHHIRKDGVGTGIWAIATAYYWGQIQQSLGIPDTGDPDIARYTNGVYTFCVMLEDCKEIRDLGLTPGNSNRKTNEQMANQKMGNGWGIVWNENAQDQSTCDESLSTCHRAPDESTGNFTIVKNYVTKTDDVYTDDGCYAKTQVANTISIETEVSTTGYTLKKWHVTDSTTTSITGVAGGTLTWDSNVPGSRKQSGTTPSLVDLEQLQGKTVYLLLVKETLTPTTVVEGGDFIIPQSSLTKRVWFSTNAKTPFSGVIFFANF